MENSQNPLKSFWTQHEGKIILCIGLILVATVSFEFGFMQGKNRKDAPMLIEKPSQELKTGPGQENDATMNSDSSATRIAPESNNVTSGDVSPVNKNCAFVGSKSSDKFYPPSCSYAKRIKPENVVCFSSAQEAISQGRTQSTGCAK